MKNFLNKYWAILCIIIFWTLFASPHLLHGKVPFAADYQVTFFAPWSAYTQFAQPVKNAAMPDVIGQIYPWKFFTIQTLKSGQIPLWNPYSFAGTPHLANYQSAVLSITNILFFIFPFVDAWSLSVLLQPLLAGLFMYVFMRKNVSKQGSLLSSIAFMFCGFIVVWMGYETLGYAILYLPLALYAMESYFEKRNFRFLLLLAATFPLSFFSGHFQISLYFAFGVLAYLFLLFLKTKKKNESVHMLFFLFLGTLLCLPQIFPTLEFYQQSLRGVLFQRIEVIPWGYLPTLFSPDFFGNPVTRNDWFGHYAEWNGYIGVVALIVAFISLKKIREQKIIFFWILAIVAVIFAFPTPIGDFLVWLKIPVLSTSAASRVIVLFSISVSALAGFGYDILLEQVQRKSWRTLFLWIALIIVFVSLLWAVVLLKLFLPLDKVSIAKSNLMLPSLLIVLSLCTVVLSTIFKKYAKIILLGIILLAAFDSFRFASKWQPFLPKSLVSPAVGMTKEFAKIQGYDRAVGNYGAEVSVFYHLPSLEGYDPLYPRREGELMASISDGKLQEASRSVVEFPKNGIFTPQMINLMNVSYIIHKISDTGKVWTFPYWQYPNNQFSLLFNDGVYQVYKNNNTFPHAFLASSYVVETNQQKILDKLFSKNTNLRNTVVLEEDPKITHLSNNGSSHIISYTPNSVQVKVQTPSQTILFLSDTYYPGWKAYVDKKETKIYRADYAFRAIVIPSGSHTIEFSYQPASFTAGLIGFAIGLLGIVVSFLLLRRRK